MTKTVITRQEGAIRWIGLNRPERLNAMNGPLVADLTAALEEANADPDTRIIVLYGEGRAFCSGDDLKDIDDQTGSAAEALAWIESIQNVTRLIMQSDRIVIAAVHGWCVGGALEWVVNCDFRIFADNARWFFPEVSWGLFVTGGVTALLTKHVGPQTAKELMILGEKHDAAMAVKVGIAWKTCPTEALQDEVRGLAARIIDKPQGSVADMKHAVNTGFHASLEEAMALETEITVRGFLSAEALARVKGF